MSKQTVTSELRKSIEKVTGEAVDGLVYSDSRKGNAVGVKFAYVNFILTTVEKVVEDMQSKGYKLKYARFNGPQKGEDYRNMFSTTPGFRFTFYNK